MVPLPEGHAVVLDAVLVAPSSPAIAGEPVTFARLRDARGTLREVRIVGGPNARGGVTRLGGYVVPVKGAVVRLDLRAEPALPGIPGTWTPNTPSAVWATTSLPVAFSVALPRSRDLGLAEDDELDVALRTWPLVSCTAYRTAFATPTSVPAGDDGVNGVYWHDDAWPAELIANAIGQTILHTNASGALDDTDLHINGAAYRFTLDGRAGTIDARSVLTHELGHALGLGHTAVPGATMAPGYPGGIAWRSLEADDRAGVCALYPGVGSAGCEEGPPCPAMFACVAKSCERTGSLGEVCSPCARVPGACAGAGDDARCIDIDAGLVCGRACVKDGECGGSFLCLPTTSSGDLQCVPSDGCAAGPDPCASNAACKGGAVCAGGACVGPREGPDAGVTGDAGGPTDAPLPLSGGGSGCSCRVGAAREYRGAWTLLLLVPAAVRRRSRPSIRRLAPRRPT